MTLVQRRADKDGGASSTNGIASWSGKVGGGGAGGSALIALIAAVLSSRSARAVKQEDRDKRSVLQKLRAEKLRRELKEEGAMNVVPVEEEEEEEGSSSGDEGLDLSVAGLLPDPEPFTTPATPIYSSPFAEPSFFLPSSTPRHFPNFPPSTVAVESSPNEASRTSYKDRGRRSPALGRRRGAYDQQDGRR